MTFDKTKPELFLSATEPNQRIMIAEVIMPKPWRHRFYGVTYEKDYMNCCMIPTSGGNGLKCTKCSSEVVTIESSRITECSLGLDCPFPDPIDTDFRILAYELQARVDKGRYFTALEELFSYYQRSGKIDYVNMEYWLAVDCTATDRICAALMAWPEKENEK